MSVPADPAVPPGAPSPGAPGAPSRIADLSYRNYDGELRTRTARWWIVALATLRANVNRRKLGYWIPAVLIALVYLISGVIFYFTQNLRQQLGSMPGAPALNFYALTLFQCLSGAGVLLFAAALTVGSSAIAADNRANALLVYLSKPITRTDYLVGKWAGVFLLLAAISFLPSLLLYLFFLVAYTGDGFLRQNPTLILRIAGATLLPAALHASLILGFSAWSKSPRLAGAIYAACYFALSILTGLAGGLLIFRTPADNDAAARRSALVMSLSVDGVVKGVGMNLYDVTPEQVIRGLGGNARRRNRRAPRAESADGPPALRVGRPPLAPLLGVAAGLIVVPLLAARARVRAVEIVRG